MADITVRKGNQLRLEDLGQKVEGLNPSAGKDFLSLKLSKNPIHPVLIAHLFHVRYAIFAPDRVRAVR